MNLATACIIAAGVAPGPGMESPVKDVVAYKRQTTSGIPGAQASLPTSYFIYVVLAKGRPATEVGVWLDGKYRAATLKKVGTPVSVDHDTAVPTGKRDVLVPRTSDDVYQVEPGEEKGWSPKDNAERALTETNEVVVFLATGQHTWHCPVRKVKTLHPASGM
jgi:hypothetical protein